MSLGDNMKEKIRQELESLMTEIDFSGVVSIYQYGELLYQSGRGFRDRSNELNNNLATRFGIASGTKLFTALGIGTLIEQGKLSLEDRVFNYFKEVFPTYDPSVTVGQLLSHTSGLPDYFDEDKIEDFDNFTVSVPWYDLKRPRDYFKVFPKEEMKFSPGTLFNYNNSGYILLAALISEISGMPYTEYIEQSILKPLGLSDSGFYPMNKLPKNTAIGYIDAQDGWRTNVYNLPIVGGGDGGLFTTISDLNKFWEGVYSGHVISKDLVETFFSNIIQTKPESDSYYGYGIWIYDAKDLATEVYIMGADAGISFKSAVVKEKELVYTVISNTGEGAWPILKKIVQLGLDT